MRGFGKTLFDATMRFARLAVLCAGAALISVPAHAEFQIEGDATALRIEATQTPVSEIFAALSAIYGIEINATVLPDQPVTGIYTGSLQRVIGHLLERYDYVLSVSAERIDIAFLGVRAGQGALVQVAQQAGKPLVRMRRGDQPK